MNRPPRSARPRGRLPSIGDQSDDSARRYRNAVMATASLSGRMKLGILVVGRKRHGSLSQSYVHSGEVLDDRALSCGPCLGMSS